MKTNWITLLNRYSLAISLLLTTSCNKINSVNDPHFDDNGYCLDSIKETFIAEPPKDLRFYVEVSGSMNGFFRANRATQFKEDVWSIVSNFGGNDIYVLSNSGTVSGVYSVSQFRSKMNSGDFVSNQETLVPTMLQSILENLDIKNNNCAVLISDMKYSPERQNDVRVLLTQYQSDIRNVIGNCTGLSVSLIMAKSNFLSANGQTISNYSPYYFLILGNDKNVAFMRNCISILLEDNGHFGDCIEAGLNYKSPAYTFEYPDNAIQLYDQPTFTNYDVEYSDTCKISLNIDLSDYRWLITDERSFRECFSAQSAYGSEVIIGDVTIQTDNHFNREFKRKATAKVELKICNMITDSDVIEWSLNHPDQTISADFSNIIAATAENDYTGSFSVNRFIAGMFNAIQNSWDKEPNRILISKTKI